MVNIEKQKNHNSPSKFKPVPIKNRSADGWIQQQNPPWIQIVANNILYS